MALYWKYLNSDKPLFYSFMQHLIKYNFPFLNVSYSDESIWVNGIIHDPDWLNKYKFNIKYTIGRYPQTNIDTPQIIPSAKIHMYSDKTLCLYHPNDLPYNYRFNLALDIIPWTIKWMHYYEIWLINGHIWTGPEAPHG